MPSEGSARHVDQYVADVRALVRWWVASLGAIAALAIGGLSLADTSGMSPWARAGLLAVLALLFAVSVVVLLSTGHLFRVPRPWEDLTLEERTVALAERRTTPDDVEEWLRSTSSRERAVAAMDAAVDAVRLQECEQALISARRRIAVWACAAGVLVVLAATLRGLPPWWGQDDCEAATTRGCDFAAVGADPRAVTVSLTGGDDAVGRAQQALTRRLGGAACAPPARFDAYVVGGTWGRPVVAVDLPGCDARSFVLEPEDGALVAVSDRSVDRSGSTDP